MFGSGVSSIQKGGSESGGSSDGARGGDPDPTPLSIPPVVTECSLLCDYISNLHVFVGEEFV